MSTTVFEVASFPETTPYNLHNMCLLSAMCPLLGKFLVEELNVLSNTTFIRFLRGTHLYVAEKLMKDSQNSKFDMVDQVSNMLKVMNVAISNLPSFFETSKIIFLLVWSFVVSRCCDLIINDNQSRRVKEVESSAKQVLSAIILTLLHILSSKSIRGSQAINKLLFPSDDFFSYGETLYLDSTLARFKKHIPELRDLCVSLDQSEGGSLSVPVSSETDSNIVYYCSNHYTAIKYNPTTNKMTHFDDTSGYGENTKTAHARYLEGTSIINSSGALIMHIPSQPGKTQEAVWFSKYEPTKPQSCLPHQAPILPQQQDKLPIRTLEIGYSTEKPPKKQKTTEEKQLKSENKKVGSPKVAKSDLPIKEKKALKSKKSEIQETEGPEEKIVVLEPSSDNKSGALGGGKNMTNIEYSVIPFSQGSYYVLDLGFCRDICPSIPKDDDETAVCQLSEYSSISDIVLLKKGRWSGSMTKEQFETAVNTRLSLSSQHYMFTEHLARDTLANIKPNEVYSKFLCVNKVITALRSSDDDDYIQVDSELEEEFDLVHNQDNKKTPTKTKMVQHKPKSHKGRKSWKERNNHPESRIGSFENDTIKEYFQLGSCQDVRYHVVTKPFPYDDEDVEWELLLASSSIAAMIEHNIPPKSSSVSTCFGHANLRQGKSRIYDEIPDDTPVRSPMTMLRANANKASNRFYAKGNEIDVVSPNDVFDMSKSQWLTDVEIHPSYTDDDDCENIAEYVEMMRRKFQSQLPNFQPVIKNLCSNLFFAFILFLPTDFIFSIFLFSNYNAEESELVSFWDIIGIFLFWVERRGLVSIYGPINQQSGQDASYTQTRIMKTGRYHKKLGFIRYNKADCEHREHLAEKMSIKQGYVPYGEEGRINTDMSLGSRSAVTACHQFNKYYSELVQKTSIAVIDEVSVPYEGSDAFHIVKSASKVHHVAIEMKTLNDVSTGVRIGLLPVMSDVNAAMFRRESGHYNDHPDPFCSLQVHTWYILKLLSMSGILEDAAKKPKLVIADAAFASVQTAYILKDAYGIDFLGPIKTCCKGSCRKLVNSLELPDQVGFVLSASLSFPPKPYSESLQEVRDTFQQSYHHLNQNKPVRMYQFVDGMQNLVTTYNCANIHHHSNIRELRSWVSKYSKCKHNTPMGFLCLTPRYYYRIYYNTCDEQNRSLRRVGALHNTTPYGAHKVAQLIVDTAIDNLHKYLTSTGQTKLDVANFRNEVVNSAVIHLSPFTTTRKRFIGGRKSQDSAFRARCAEILTKSLSSFSKKHAGLEHRQNRTSSSQIFCSQCPPEDQYCALLGCTICGEKLPNQVFCVACAANHIQEHHMDNTA